jgi:hypothetical protein
MTVHDAGVSLPTGLMDCSHHRDDMPRAVCRTRGILQDTQALWSTNIPHDLLLVKVIKSQKMWPCKNAILSTNNNFPNFMLLPLCVSGHRSNYVVTSLSLCSLVDKSGDHEVMRVCQVYLPGSLIFLNKTYVGTCGGTIIPQLIASKNTAIPTILTDHPH